jgi:hypothetical protein
MLREVIELSELCLKDALQSDLDTLIGKFDLNLKDCSLVRKTGVLGEETHSSIKKLLATSYKAY